ncbi:MAG TPA: hypothetical protein IAB61_04435 [Candidatus Merdisoma merdipullorum]|nr:hypothetical protein [Candidatus Merdisoma merdipullorum]
MILVDVEAPSLGRDYQFSLDENSPVELLLDEIVEMISQKEHCEIPEDKEQLCLCSRNRGKILSRKKTLAEQGVTGADWLILL